jgi:hypothetical protein
MAVIVRGREADTPKASYPPDHKAGTEVPKGGSCCANCEYLNWDKKTCSSQYFIRWNGSPKIPMPDGDPTRFCSDWWEHASEK